MAVKAMPRNDIPLYTDGSPNNGERSEALLETASPDLTETDAGGIRMAMTVDTPAMGVLSNSDHALARKAMEAMRRRHMLTAQDALRLGISADELVHDARTFAEGIARMVAVSCR